MPVLNSSFRNQISNLQSNKVRNRYPSCLILAWKWATPAQLDYRVRIVLCNVSYHSLTYKIPLHLSCQWRKGMMKYFNLNIHLGVIHFCPRIFHFQYIYLQILEYTLKKNHPGCPRILAETLLILPVLREHSLLVRKYLYSDKEELHPDLPPLINEVL